jgi:hypothetical protein
MFTFAMRLADGSPVNPPTFTSSEPNWRVGDDVRVGADVRFRIVAIEVPADGAHGVWIVEPRPERTLGGDGVAA